MLDYSSVYARTSDAIWIEPLSLRVSVADVKNMSGGDALARLLMC